jgi:glycosyltransferase involved in cell wall biosynthesis
MESAATALLAKEGVAHHRLPFGSATVNPFRELWGLIAMAMLLRRLRPDIVHGASPKGILYGGIASRLAGVPSLVLAISGMGYAFAEGGGRDLSRQLLGKVISALARLGFGHRNKKVIVQNTDDKEWVTQSRLCPREDVHLIPGSGVDAVFFQVSSSNKTPLVVFPARLLRDKGVIEFADAVRLIKARVPGWRFLIAGAADYRSPSAVPRAAVEKWVAEGLVEWPGHVSDMAPLLAQASIVCLPSYYREGLPKALLEAEAAGCAVITADSVGCREAIVAGETGDLVPPRNAAALAAALLALIADPQRREAYGRSGRLLAQQRFSLGAILAQIFDLYAVLHARA